MHLAKRRLHEILPQTLEEKLAALKANKTPSMTIIATKGTLDWAYPPFILSSTATADGARRRCAPVHLGVRALCRADAW
ncbi:MAG: DsrE/DsrF/DrsH-like family protein [Burkholderiales bacterium]